MEMRSVENIDGLGIDLTRHLRPLAFSLSDSYLHRNCATCFQSLPSPNTHSSAPINYCSLPCSSLDSPLHLSSGEHHLFHILQSHPTTWHSDTTDLRTALRLLHRFTSLNLLQPPYDRIGGLLTNREKLKQRDNDKIKEGARLMSIARNCGDENHEVEEMVLCIVLTNAVEVQVNENVGIGVAVYGPGFSWINHSCTPNACYRFTIFETNEHESTCKMRIGAFGDESVQKNYGPRIVVRSIKPIKKGEEVSVTYTNLLLPKATRDLELWSRYTFKCLCTRCSASPPTYVDCALRGNFVANLEPTNSSWDHNFCKYDAYEEISDELDEIISEYLLIGNSETCCHKLENMLFRHPKEEQLQAEEESWPTFKLHPLCHLSLNAYITLASAYKIRASEFLSNPLVLDNNKLESFALSRISAAYSLLLAGASHHLFLFEHSFIVSAAHFWISAGESLLSVARSSISELTLAQRYSDSFMRSLPSHSCNKCPLIDSLVKKLVSEGSQSISTEAEFEDISIVFMKCASTLSSKVWPFLIEGKDYFKDINDPVDFSWIPSRADSTFGVLHTHVSGGNGQYCDLKCGTEHYKHGVNGSVSQLGAHCLLYGGYLASICYGRSCYWTNNVGNLLE
ncbi:hypothetical protein ACHQM5_015371 [Ranunculus cassubicifolius]